MSSIIDLLNSDLGRELVNGASEQMGMDKQSATGALGAAIPLILGAMKNNAGTSEGSEQLMNALNDPRHSNGSVLDNLSNILGGGSVDQDVLNDGGSILGHVFGGQEHNAANALSKSSGIDMNSAMNLLKIAAPVIMSYLGRNMARNNISEQGGLGDLLGSLLGGQGVDMQSMASLIQGFDSNDKSIDDIASMMGPSSPSSGGLGSLLGNLFK